MRARGVGDGDRRRQVDRRERAERAVVDDVGIGDRQDHARRARADTRGRATSCRKTMFGRPKASVLAFIPWSAVSTIVAPSASSAREVAVHHRVEVVGGADAGRRLVLDVVGRRQVHDVGPLALAAASRRRRTRTRTARRCRPRAPACRPAPATSSMPLRPRVASAGLLRREADARHPVAEQRAQLVLGGDDGDLRAGVGEARRGSCRRAGTSGRSSSLRRRRRGPRSSCRRCRAPTAARR